VKYWTAQISFEERRSITMGNGFYWLEVAPPGADSCIVLYPKQQMPDWGEMKPSIEFQSENIDVFCQALKDKGVVFAKELSQIPWGKFASFLDPDGNEFGIRGPWEK
jgi:predicted enzyme related to lactoylglutathione lyase